MYQKSVFKKSFITFTLILCLICLVSKGQSLINYNKPVAVKVISKLFDQDREVRIYLPKAYNETPVSYPVLYVLDGQRKELEQFAMATTDYMLNFKTIPPFIVLVIPQIKRGFELNPAIPGQNISAIGGADGFLTYLSDVDSYLKKAYRIAPFNIIFGHSLGGSLATYALLKRPNLFNAYIIASPNYTFNKGYYYKSIDSLVAANLTLVKSKFIYLTAGDQWQVEKNFRSSTLKGDSIFKKALSDKYFFADSKGYGHNTTPTIAFVDGMSKIFASYWQGGQVLGDDIWGKKGDPANLVADYYKRLSEQYGYTIKPNLADYQYYTGKAYLDLKDYKSAEKYVTEGLKTYPNDPDLLVVLGDAKAGLKRKEDAREIYNKAMKLSKDEELKNDVKKKLEAL